MVSIGLSHHSDSPRQKLFDIISLSECFKSIFPCLRWVFHFSKISKSALKVFSPRRATFSIPVPFYSIKFNLYLKIGIYYKKYVIHYHAAVCFFKTPWSCGNIGVGVGCGLEVYFLGIEFIQAILFNILILKRK